MDKNTIIKEGYENFKNNNLDKFLSNNIKCLKEKEKPILNKKQKLFLENSCKNILVESIYKSNIDEFSKNNSFKKIKEMNYNDTIKYFISLNEGEIINLNEFGIRDFESKFKKFLKYGLAAIAGGFAGGKLGVGKKISVSVSMVLYYLFRKHTDPCWKQCVSSKGMAYNKSCQYKCKMDACHKLLNDLRSQLSKCEQTPNPEKCQKTLKRNHETWTKKLQTYTISFRKHEIKAKEKERNTKG